MPSPVPKDPLRCGLKIEFRETFAASLPSLDVKVPTLVIWGEKDHAAHGKSGGPGAVRSQPAGPAHSDGTHWVIHEQPSLVNAYIREFIGKK